MAKTKTEAKVKEKRLTGGLFWNPKQGDEIIGYLVAIRQGNYQRDIYDIKTEEGIVTIPSSSVLAGVFNKDSLDKKFRVKMLGWGKDKLQEKKPGTYRLFDVFLIEEE